MRRLHEDYRLHSYSLPEIRRAWEEWCLSMDDDLTLNGRKAKPGPILNAVVLMFLSSPQGERIRVAREGLAKLEYLMALPGQPADIAAGFPVKATHLKASGGKAVRRKKLD